MSYAVFFSDVLLNSASSPKNGLTVGIRNTMVSKENEFKRVLKVYRTRDKEKAEVYTWRKPDIHATIFSVDYAISRVLIQNGITDFSSLLILDVGCGKGRWLRLLNEWGANPSNLYGVDLNPDRIRVARRLSPHINFSTNIGEELPFKDGMFDLVTCKTVFSSILKAELRSDLAKQMINACSEGGKILVFDFKFSDPRNTDTIGIDRNEIGRLFPGWSIDSRSVLLAPPLLRFACKFSPHFGVFLEWMLPFLRTHRIYLLSKFS